jgi:type I restriction enzyme S subunit
VTTEQLFAKFELFAGAPDALPRLRQLILELAVRGQLTTHSSTPPKNHPSAPSDPSAGPFPIPEDWQWLTLKELGDTKPRNEAPDHKICAFVPMALIPAEYGGEPAHETRKWGEIKKGYTHFADGDVVMAKITPCFENGKSAVMRGLSGDIGAGTTELHVFRGDISRVLPPYVLICLKSRGFIERGIPKMTGSAGQKRVPHDYFANSPFPLPPLAEQKRIVAKVDELMALCDQLEAQQQERETKHATLSAASLARFAEAPTPANLNLLFHHSYDISPADLRKTILTLAVQGKLVPFSKTIDGSTVGDHVEFQNGYAFKSQWFKPSGIRLCRNLNVSHGNLDWREAACVDEKIASEFARFGLSDGDIVLSLDRPLITTGLKVARVRQVDLPCLLLQRVAKPVPKHNMLDLSYFMLWLNSSEFVDSIDPGRSNGVPHISTRQVQRLPFLLPPLAEQKRIVAKVDELMALVDQLEEQLASSHTLAAQLTEAVVAELTAAA